MEASKSRISRGGLCVWAFLAAGGAAAGAEGDVGEGVGALRRQHYEGLFPFYSRETFEEGGERTAAFFHLFRSEREPDGDGYAHLLPFFYRSSFDGGADRKLGLLPLYLRGRSPEGSYDVVLPSFAHWRSGPPEKKAENKAGHTTGQAAEHTVIWPLLQTAREPEETPFRLIPTLYRHGGSSDETRDRLGAPFVLDLFQSLKESDRTTITALHLFNFSRETESGIALGKLSLSKSGDWHARLLPLFLLNKEEKSGLVWTPVLSRWWRENGGGWLCPPFYLADESRAADGSILSSARFYSLFYGETRSASDGSTARYAPLLLSRLWRREKDLALDVLWPLGHYSREGEAVRVRALPFFDRARDSRGESLGVGGLLYRRHEDRALNSVSSWVLPPFVHWRTSPSGLLAWGFPGFFRRKETGPAGEVSTLIVAPSFYSHTERTTYPDRSAGVAADDSAGRLTHERRVTAVWPLFGLDRTSVEGEERVRTWSTLFPLFQWRRESPPAEGGRGRTLVHAPWPFVDFSRGADSTRFRIAPWLFDWNAEAYSTSVTGLLGAFGYHAQDDHERFHLFPIGFGERTGDRGKVGVFPFYYGWLDRSAAPDSPGALRFFFAWNRIVTAERSHHSLFWKAVEHTREASGDFDFRLFHRLVVNRRVQGQRELLVNPLFRHETDARTGDRSFSILHFVYRTERRAGVETKRVFGLPIWRRA